MYFQEFLNLANLRKEKLTTKGIQEEQYDNFGYEFRGFDDTDIIYFSNVSVIFLEW